MGGSAGNLFLLTREVSGVGVKKMVLGGLEQACQLVLFLWPDLGAVWTDLASFMEKLRVSLLTPKILEKSAGPGPFGVLEA